MKIEAYSGALGEDGKPELDKKGKFVLKKDARTLEREIKGLKEDIVWLKQGVSNAHGLIGAFHQRIMEEGESGIIRSILKGGTRQ